MSKILSKLNEFVKSLTGILIVIMMVLVVVQVFFRYVLNNPLSGTQEIARFAMVWLVMLGSSVAIRNESHVSVSFVTELMPKRINKIFRIIKYILVILFFYIFLVSGWDLTTRSMVQLSPSNRIPMGYIIVSLPITAVLSIIYSIEKLLTLRKKD